MFIRIKHDKSNGGMVSYDTMRCSRIVTQNLIDYLEHTKRYTGDDTKEMYPKDLSDWNGTKME